MWAGEPWGNSGRKEYLTSSSHQTTVTPSEPWGNSGCESTGYWPANSWGAYQRNDFSESPFLHPSVHRKTLHSLTWEIWVFLINNLLMFRLPALCCKTSILSGTSPFLPRAVLSGSLEMLSLRLEVLKIATKSNAQLLGCKCFLSRHQLSDTKWSGNCSDERDSEKEILPWCWHCPRQTPWGGPARRQGIGLLALMGCVTQSSGFL